MREHQGQGTRSGPHPKLRLDPLKGACNIEDTHIVEIDLMKLNLSLRPKYPSALSGGQVDAVTFDAPFKRDGEMAALDPQIELSAALSSTLFSNGTRLSLSLSHHLTLFIDSLTCPACRSDLYAVFTADERAEDEDQPSDPRRGIDPRAPITP